MACGCRGARTASGEKVTGYEVTFPDGTTATYLTQLEAKTERRKRGGGTIRALTNSG